MLVNSNYLWICQYMFVNISFIKSNVNVVLLKTFFLVVWVCWLDCHSDSGLTTSYGLTSYVHGRLDKPIYIFFLSPLRFYSLVSNISSSLNLTLGVNPNRKIQIGSDHLFEMDWKITNLMSLNQISNFTCENITRFDPPDYLVNFYFILFFNIFFNL